MAGDTQTKLRVGVLFGGRSGEHEVSLLSARSVIETLEASGRYEVVPIGIRRSGGWLVAGDALPRLAGEAGFSLPGSVEAGPAPTTETALLPDPRQIEGLDVVFPVLHGPYGEDGTVQGLLELADLPYVGCGVAASAVAMDKLLCKSVLADHGLPVVATVPVLAGDWGRDSAPFVEAVERLGYPVFVKPANMGSSVGISRVERAEGLAAAIDDAARYDTRLLVERAIDAREIECSVLGNDRPRASVPGEVIPAGEFYDYEAKYLEQGSELVIPAELEPATADQIRDLAVAAFAAIGGSGMARVDFLLDRKRGELWINELNTIPGFTPISMYAKLWEASGLPYPELIDRLIELALERHRTRRALSDEYRPR